MKNNKQATDEKRRGVNDDGIGKQTAQRSTSWCKRNGVGAKKPPHIMSKRSSRNRRSPRVATRG